MRIIVRMKSKVPDQDPKAEIRRPKETRSETRDPNGQRLGASWPIRLARFQRTQLLIEQGAFSGFGFRPSFGFRVAAFGFRTVLALAGLASLLSGCKPAQPEPLQKPPAPLVVKVTAPKRGPITRYVTLPGEIKAYQQATLYAKVAGYLKTITVDK